MPEHPASAALRAALLAVLLCVGPFTAAAAQDHGLSPTRLNRLASPEPNTAPGEGQDREEQELERGRATWYGRGFQGRRTASGERFNMNALTAAHRTLPFGTRLRVRNLHNSQEVVVRINDRGPFRKDMVIDLSRAAAESLGLIGHGVKEVILTVVEPIESTP